MSANVVKDFSVTLNFETADAVEVVALDSFARIIQVVFAWLFEDFVNINFKDCFEVKWPKEQAYSVTIDSHKQLFIPMGSGVLTLKNHWTLVVSLWRGPGQQTPCTCTRT